ncbi:hypothetical protein ACJ5NV_01435 [Loktanella agnita]|uniref:hypothetical protein n=1 Tax=Loktanella agnita TaxID=287097 RepID=UPI0039884B57
MSTNPLALTRFCANAALVAVLLAFLVTIPAGYGDQSFWAWLIGAIAIGGAIAQFIVSIFAPRSIRPAWDEQVVASHRASLQFGYWMALCAFVVLFLLTQFGSLSAASAFFAMAPILAAAPSVWMIGAALAGRAG